VVDLHVKTPGAPVFQLTAGIKPEFSSLPFMVVHFHSRDGRVYCSAHNPVVSEHFGFYGSSFACSVQTEPFKIRQIIDEGGYWATLDSGGFDVDRVSDWAPLVGKPFTKT
jgi:hypothetical protein